MLKILQILVLIASTAIVLVAAYWMSRGYYWEVMSAGLALIVYDMYHNPEHYRRRRT